MSAYLEAQLAVYQHLLARHERDPEFRFSMRQTAFTGNGLFIGREFPAGTVKPYFSFSCWQIDSGSQGEVLGYDVEEVAPSQFRVWLDLHPRPNGNQQDAINRSLTNEVRQQLLGPWLHAAPYGRLFAPQTVGVAQLPAVLDALLTQTKPQLDRLVLETQRKYPSWKGSLYSASKFAQMLAGLRAKRGELLAGDFGSVALEQQLKRLPTLWSVALLSSRWAWTLENRRLHFSAKPKKWAQLQLGDLLVAVDSTSDRRAFGLGRITSLEADHSLVIGWLSTQSVSFHFNTYSTSALEKSNKLAETITAYQTVMPDLWDKLLVGRPTAIETEEDSAGPENEVPVELPTVETSAAYTAATAHAEGLFLTEEEITEMVEALRVKKNIILKGPPGVGKTFVARKLAYVLFGENAPDRVELLQFHPSVSYEDFVRGWRPQAGGTLGIADGPLLQFVAKARRAPTRDYVLLLDEINRGNLSKIFGELFMLLEADKRSAEYGVALTYPNPDAPDERVFLPPNFYVIGTMNTADRSLALVDFALRRRFRFFDLRPQLDEELVHFLTSRYQADAAALRPRLQAVRELNARISDSSREPLLGPGFAIGHSYFCPPDQQPIADVAVWFSAIVRHELLPLLEEYWDGDTKGADKLKKYREALLTAGRAEAPAPAAAETAAP